MYKWRGVKKQQGDRVWYGIQNLNPVNNSWVDHQWPTRESEGEIRAIVAKMNTPDEPIITTILE